MEDVLTEIPPPSRFFQEDLNNFAPPSLALPSPFLLFLDNKHDKPLFPYLLIVALSNPSRHVLNCLSSKKLIGSLTLPEIPFSGNSVEPSLGDNRATSMPVMSQNFRGKLSPDETYAFKLETLAARKALEELSGAPLVSGVDYFPSGSMVDGLAAALLAKC